MLGKMTQPQLYWVAGIIEGEGCIAKQITTKRSAKYCYWQLTVTNTDFDVLERLLNWTQVGTIYNQKRQNKNYKQTWQWRVYRQPEVLHLLSATVSLFCERRKKRADEALADLAGRTFRAGRRQIHVGYRGQLNQLNLPFEGPAK